MQAPPVTLCSPSRMPHEPFLLNESSPGSEIWKALQTYTPHFCGLGPSTAISKVSISINTIYYFSKTFVAFLRKPEKEKQKVLCQVLITSILQKQIHAKGKQFHLAGGWGLGLLVCLKRILIYALETGLAFPHPCSKVE